ncbi:MAG: hypothetical protein ACOC4Z_00530 [Patescibacteria group bacterium]
MSAYSEIISQLVTASSPEDSTTFFLTAYLPLDNNNKAEVKQYVKSPLFTALRNHEQLKSYKNLRHNLVQSVNNKINKLEKLGQGLAIFTKIDLENRQEEKTKISEKEITLLPLNNSPKKETRIGHTYDLDQLVWMNNIAGTGLIISLRGTEGHIYQIDLSGISSEEGVLKVERKPEARERVAPKKVRDLHYSTGTNKLQKAQENERLRLLKDVKETIKTSPTAKNFEYLIVFASSAFSELVPNLINDKSLVPTGTEVIVVDKNIEDEQELKKVTYQKIIQAQKEKINTFFQQAKENPHKYIEGWNSVVPAAYEGQIQIIFIKPDLEISGYIKGEDNLPSLEAIPESRKVNNLAPWIVRRVVQTEGDIAVWYGIANRDVPDIAAFLRYSKEEPQ